MDTKSKALILAFFVLFSGAVAWEYHIFFAERDFLILGTISCDPRSESCFTSDCTGTEECDDGSVYKKIEKNAKNIRPCGVLDTTACEELSCEKGEENCVITICADESLEEGEQCVQYTY